MVFTDFKVKQKIIKYIYIQINIFPIMKQIPFQHRIDQVEFCIYTGLLYFKYDKFIKYALFKITNTSPNIMFAIT